MIYVYALRNRPAMYGTVPQGRIVELDAAYPPPYGMVTYDHPLTAEEVYRYELIPVGVKLPMYEVGTKVKDLRTGTVCTIEFWEGASVASDRPLETVHDWVFFAPLEDGGTV